MRPFLLFAPGAGAPSSHPWMQHWKERLSALGEVVTLDYDYMREARKRPDPLPVLIARHRDALRTARSATPSSRIFLVGKSMGGRVSCHVALEESVAGVICFGYPLCAMGDRTKMRDAVLRQLRSPILFLQGTRDSLCPLDLLENVRSEMTAPNQLYVVEGGDHSLRVRRKDSSQQVVDDGIFNEVRRFVSTLTTTEGI